MHDDFYKMIGCLYAESFLAKTRNAQLQSAGSTTAADTASLGLTAVAERLLSAAFNFEIPENIFQKEWTTQRGPITTAITGFAAVAGRYNRMPVAGGSLNREYKQLLDVTNPGTGENARRFIEGIARRTQQTLTAAGQNATPSLLTLRDALKDLLLRMEVALNDFEFALETMHRAFTDAADDYLQLYPSLATSVRPWSAQDERLRQMMDFLFASAQSGVGQGPGGTSTPSWGSTGTLGSSSSSSSSGSGSGSSGS